MNGKGNKPRQPRLSESATQLGRSAVGVCPVKGWRLLQEPPQQGPQWQQEYQELVEAQEAEEYGHFR